LRISTRGRYGLRALVDLALNNPTQITTLRSIAENQNISESYLEQVFTSLRKAGLVMAIRGAQGGYKLGRPADRITVAEILKSLEGPLAPVQCVGMGAVQQCDREDSCFTRSFWEDLNKVINDFLGNTTLQDLVDRANQAVSVPQKG
jgi:Rrf2 family cysteine metabolism transcriptional repressor